MSQCKSALMLQHLYQCTMRYAGHPYAPCWLFTISFFEGFIFPVPPELLLAPMAVAHRHKAYWLGTLSLVGSILGSSIGYFLGRVAIHALGPLLHWIGWDAILEAQILRLQSILSHSPWQAFILLVMASFSPIPLKVLSWACGMVGFSFPAFIASMVLGRAKRVYLVALTARLSTLADKKRVRYAVWMVCIFLFLTLLWMLLFT